MLYARVTYASRVPIFTPPLGGALSSTTRWESRRVAVGMGDGRGLHDRAALFAPRSRGTAHNKVHGVNDSGRGGGEEGGGGGFADPPLEEARQRGNEKRLS